MQVIQDMEAVTKNANCVKDIILAQLKKDGHISEQLQDRLAEEYVMIIAERSWFGKAWAKYVTKEEKLSTLLLKSSIDEEEK